MDEVRVWRRVLTTDEVRASYDAHAFPLGTTSLELTPGSHTYSATAVPVVGDAVTASRSLTVE